AVDPKQSRIALRAIEGDRLHHPDVDIEPGAVEAETFWGRNLDLRAPFAIEMRQLPLTRTVGIAHKQLCRHRGFGGGKRDRSRRSRNGESVDRAAPPDDDDWQIPTLGTYAEERIGAVIATDEEDPL